MKPTKSLIEKYVSLTKLSNKVSVSYSTNFNLCVSNRYRLFKFNGVRCLEITDAICLISSLKALNKIDETAYNLTYNWLNNMR